jgi:hypothetical protein
MLDGSICTQFMWGMKSGLLVLLVLFFCVCAQKPQKDFHFNVLATKQIPVNANSHRKLILKSNVVDQLGLALFSAHTKQLCGLLLFAKTMDEEEATEKKSPKTPKKIEFV